MLEIQRQPHEAELALSNAITCLSEAATVIRQYMPDDDAPDDPGCAWRHQLKKLKMAIGITGNVRDLVVHDNRFAALQPTKRTGESIK